MARESLSSNCGYPRFTRRAVLAAGGAGLATWLLGPTFASAQVVPTRGGVFQFGGIGGDPNWSAGTPTNGSSYFLVYTTTEPLVRYRGSIEPELVLVDEFTLNSEYTSLVARLKPGLTFHNGAPVTPQDVMFCVEMLANSAKYGVIPSPFSGIAKQIVDMTPLDSRTVEFHFDKLA
jgi:peptide/nickel transport system substrate-binding protein